MILNLSEFYNGGYNIMFKVKDNRCVSTLNLIDFSLLEHSPGRSIFNALYNYLV